MSTPFWQGKQREPCHWGALLGCGGHCDDGRRERLGGFLGQVAAGALGVHGHEASSGAASGTWVGRPRVTPGDGCPLSRGAKCAAALGQSRRGESDRDGEDRGSRRSRGLWPRRELTPPGCCVACVL